MFNLFAVILIILVGATDCYSHSCTPNIPEAIKTEYAIQIQAAFSLQSEGLSTSAMFNFDQGATKAINAGESPRKIEAIRQLFTWYRTYGYYLGLMKKDPQILGQYIGNGKYSTSSRSFREFSYGKSPERDANIRDYLYGVTEVLSGMLCCWLMGPKGYVIGGSLILDGLNTARQASNALWIEKEIAMREFKRAENNIKVASELVCCITSIHREQFSFMPRSTMKTMERYNDRKKNNIKFLSLNRYIIQS
ncbi:MAG TPA: hypothetical protein VLF94_06950, partial [Chlamydiales bacterium]|nr:hypothetical protein [Chlamydiales bacterium]